MSLLSQRALAIAGAARPHNEGIDTLWVSPEQNVRPHPAKKTKILYNP
jgi:hypothetical protein